MTGLLAGLEDAAGVDLGSCDYFLGTSAGSIVAYRLAAGEPLRRPRDGAEGVPHTSVAQPAGGSRRRDGANTELLGFSPGADRYRAAAAGALAVASPIVGAGLALGARPGALARTALLRAAPRPTGSLGDLRERVAASGARFDGRLRITAVDRQSGRRVIFGAPGAPAAAVADAVEASCTVPWLFAPVRIGGREYVDGGVWSPTNLDACPAGRGSHVLCLNPTAGLGGRAPAITLARGTSRSITGLEAVQLRARGAFVSVVGPDGPAASAIGTNLMAAEASGRVHASGYRQGLQLALNLG
jgi:NTE family protein